MNIGHGNDVGSPCCAYNSDIQHFSDMFYVKIFEWGLGCLC